MLTCLAVLITAFAAAWPSAVSACPLCKAGALAELDAYDLLTLHKGPSTRPSSASTQPSIFDDDEGDALQPVHNEDNGFSTVLGIDWTTAHFHRGLNMGDRGPILEPYFTLGFPTLKLDQWSIQPYVGDWNSLQEGSRNHAWLHSVGGGGSIAGLISSGGTHDHNAPPGKNSSYQRLYQYYFGGSNESVYSGWEVYESELMGGALFTRGALQLDLRYDAHIYPGGDIPSYQELTGRVTYDWLRASTMSRTPTSPWAPKSLDTYVEVSQQIVGSDGRELYAETGLRPTWLTSIGGKTVAISVPLVVGFSGDGYYRTQSGQNETVGYWGVGIEGNVRLAEKTPLGAAYLNVSVRYLRLNSELLATVNGNDHDAIVGTVGLSFSR